MHEAVVRWPHLLQYKSGRGGGYFRLDIDLDLFDRLMGEYCIEAFGGGFAVWESKWACEEAIASTKDWDFDADDGAVLSAQTPAG